MGVSPVSDQTANREIVTHRSPNPGGSYAVAVRDGDELLLTHIIRRSPSGIYVIFRRDTPQWDPHTSHHASGQYHHKSFNQKSFKRQRQKLDANFHGTENLLTFSIDSTEPRAINVPCDVASFQGVIEIPISELRPATLMSVDITDADGKPIITPGATIIRQVAFKDAYPWILATLFDTKVGPLAHPLVEIPRG